MHFPVKIKVTPVSAEGILLRHCFERNIRDFIRRYPGGSIVNIGCGLDAGYKDLATGSVTWYDIDLPEIIRLRKICLFQPAEDNLISASFLENDWYGKIIPNDHVLLIAEDVLFYFGEMAIKKFLTKIPIMFPACELLFDAVTKSSQLFNNNIICKLVKENRYLIMWSTKELKEKLLPNSRYRMLGKYNITRLQGIRLTYHDRIKMKLCGIVRRRYIIHVKVRPDYRHLGTEPGHPFPKIRKDS